MAICVDKSTYRGFYKSVACVFCYVDVQGKAALMLAGTGKCSCVGIGGIKLTLLLGTSKIAGNVKLCSKFFAYVCGKRSVSRQHAFAHVHIGAFVFRNIGNKIVT